GDEPGAVSSISSPPTPLLPTRYPFGGSTAVVGTEPSAVIRAGAAFRGAATMAPPPIGSWTPYPATGPIPGRGARAATLMFPQRSTPLRCAIGKISGDGM